MSQFNQPSKFVQSQQWHEYYQLLSNFEFLLGKIQHPDFGIEGLINDYDWLDPTEAASNAARDADTETALQRIHLTLQLSAFVLTEDPNQLTSHLWGHLQAFNDSPVIKGLLTQAADIQPKPWLRPLFPTIQSPGKGPIRYLPGHQDPVEIFDISPDSRWVASLSGTQLTLWDTKTVTTLAEAQIEIGSPELFFGDKVALAQDGSRVAFINSDGIQVLDQSLTQTIFRQPIADVYSVALTPDGQQVIAIQESGAKVWEIETGKLLLEETGYLAVSTESKRLVRCDRNEEQKQVAIKIWHLPTGELETIDLENVEMIWRFRQQILQATFCPEYKKLVLHLREGYGTNLLLIDLVEKQLTTAGDSIETEADALIAVAISADGQELVALGQPAHADADTYGPLFLARFDFQTGRRLGRYSMGGNITYGEEIPYAAKLTSNGDYVITSHNTSTLEVWTLGKIPVQPQALAYSYGSPFFEFFANDKVIVFPHPHSEPKTTDLSTGDVQLSLPPDYAEPETLDAENTDNLIRFNDEEDQPTLTIPNHNWVIGGDYEVVYRPGDMDYSDWGLITTLTVWSAEQAEILATFTHHTDFEICGLSPDGVTLVLIDFFYNLHVFRLEMG